jgi:chromosome partitioning protein
MQDDNIITKIFSVVNQKGGVGKTTTAINLSACFAIKGKRVLLIDLDPQGNASTGMGIEVSQRQNTIYEVLIGEIKLSTAIMPTAIKNLKLVTSTVDLSVLDIEIASFENREYILQKELELVKKEYDIIIIDCPPSLGLITINAMVASNGIIIPMQCEFFSLEGLSHLLNTADLIKQNFNDNLNISGIILTMHDKRNKLTEQVEKDVRDFLGDKVYKSCIARNIKLSEAPSHGMPGIIYDPKSLGAKCYQELADEILNKEFSC